MRPDGRLDNKQRRRKTPRILERQSGQCYWCGCRLVRERDIPRHLVVFKTARFIVWRRQCGSTTQAMIATLDHVVPISRGGTHDEDNLVAACSYCNSDRADTGRPQLPAPSITDPEPVSSLLWS